MAEADIGWAHYEGLRGLLTAAALPYPLYDGEVTAPDDQLVFPYLVGWPPPGRRPTVTLNGYGGEATTRTQFTGVGLTVREAATVIDRVAAALHRRRPVIPGRRCGLVTQTDEDFGPPIRDERVHSTTGRPVFVAGTAFILVSTSAGGGV